MSLAAGVYFLVEMEGCAYAGMADITGYRSRLSYNQNSINLQKTLVVAISDTRYNGGMGNIETLTRLFKLYYKAVCETFNERLANNKVFITEREIKFRIKKASEFELGMYLLFRIDRYMCGRQKEDIRGALFDSCMYSMLPSNNERFIALVDNRMVVYGKIVNDAIESGEDWANTVFLCNDWLINAMLYCENDYDRMTTDEIPNMIIDPLEHWTIKLMMSNIESGLIVILSCVFKHVFADNDDFKMLPHQELIKRIETGFKEGDSIANKSME